MGFGRGKGFTSKVRTEMTSYLIKGGGGKVAIVETELAPTYVAKGGGGKKEVTATETTPTYTTEVVVESAEEQTEYNHTRVLYSGGTIRHGQRLTIANRRVTKLAFIIRKLGSPTGDVTFTIRKVSDDGIILSKVWGDAADLDPDNYVWEEVAFDTPVTINEEVRILCEFSGGAVPDYVVTTDYADSIKAGEVETEYIAAYTDNDDRDSTYRYKYTT